MNTSTLPKKKKKHVNIWNITIFCINKENKKKKKRLIKDKVQIENAEMNNKMTITIS